LAWEPRGSNGSARRASEPETEEKTFLHRAGDRIVKMQFASIYAVKGKTHSATLVVETFVNNQHDLQIALDVLTGKVREASPD
jgi:ATP-dependent DNA helicase UvrD/PcrA